MTRKHFIQLAAALSASNPGAAANRHAQWVEDCKAVADVCENGNDQFDRERFLEACGLTSFA